MPAMNHAYRLGFVGGASGWSHGACGRHAKIQFDRTNYDFGVTSLVESVTGTFTFQNSGDGVLELQKPRPSCGCTVARRHIQEVAAGREGGVGVHDQTLARELVNGCRN